MKRWMDEGYEDALRALDRREGSWNKILRR